MTRRARAARLMILREIARREAADERPPTLDELAQLTGLDQSTVRYHVLRMTAVGWVTHPSGWRTLALTEEGRQQLG